MLDRLRNYTGTVHYAIDGRPACGQSQTYIGHYVPTDQPVTCRACLAAHGYDVPCPLLPPPPIDYAAIRAVERAVRRAAREGQADRA